MANDPGLSNDSCIFMEAISGDGGTHNASDVWWLSPDITLTGPASGLDNADPGQINPVQVRFHRKSANSGCNFPGDESLNVELWVANPSLVMSPRAHNSSTRVGFTGSPVPAEGSSGIQQIDWDVPAAPPAGDPQSAGHKCLISRAYSSSVTPDQNLFFVPGDQHVVQHNLCIVSAASQSLRFTVNTINPGALLSPPINLHGDQVKLRAILDLHPTKFVAHTLSHRLESMAGFQSLRTTLLPRGFAFDLLQLTASDVVDHSRGGGLNPFPPQANPSYEVRVALGARQPTPITFLADLHGALPGEACIFHLTQTSINDVAEGGLTLVALKL